MSETSKPEPKAPELDASIHVLRDDELKKVTGATTSNILKTKHDTAKNSINNVR